MADYLNILLDMLTQFTGGRGGVDHLIVNYGLAAASYAALLFLALNKYKEVPQPRERLLLWGFSFGLSRELFMIFMAVIQAFGWVDPVTIHMIFPPLEHALLGIAMVTIAAAYVHYLLDDEHLAKRYLIAGIGATVCCYLATFIWWGTYIQANPLSKFGQVWPDWLFHINASLWLIIPAIYLALKTQGRVRNILIPALSFFFLSEFLKIPDMALGENYEYIFTPIARAFYLLAIPMLGYIYFYEISLERRNYLNNLEQLVKARTQELALSNHELLKKADIAHAAEKSKDEFLASMSHEIRTPMNGVLGMLELLADTPLNQQQEKYLNISRQSGESLLYIINDILDFSKVEAGKLCIEERPFDLNQLLSECINSFALQASQQNIELLCSLSPDVDARFIGDPNRIKQILINLLGNAFKFTQEGFVSLEVLRTLIDDGMEQISFNVKDSGSGISATDCDKIFEVFAQATDTTMQPSNGTGLGLSISKRLTELMGGKINVNSERGLGSTFSFTLPLRSDNKADDAVIKKAFPDQGIQACLNERRILIFDTETLRQKHLLKLCKIWGMAADCCASIDEIVLQLGQQQYALLLVSSDRKNLLPTQALHALKLQAKETNTKLISLMPLVDSELESETSQRDIHSLSRPFSPSQLKELMASQLGYIVNIESPAVKKQPPALEGLSILLVDDVEVNLIVAEAMLNKLGAHCELARNGEQALQKFKQCIGKYDAVFMDCEMPVMDGYSASRAFRKFESKNKLNETFIVAMTANVLPTHRKEVALAGMNAFLSKPIQMNTLNQVLEGISKITQPSSQTELKPLAYEREYSDC